MTRLYNKNNLPDIWQNGAGQRKSSISRSEPVPRNQNDRPSERELEARKSQRSAEADFEELSIAKALISDDFDRKPKREREREGIEQASESVRKQLDEVKCNLLKNSDLGLNTKLHISGMRQLLATLSNCARF